MDDEVFLFWVWLPAKGQYGAVCAGGEYRLESVVGSRDGYRNRAIIAHCAPILMTWRGGPLRKMNDWVRTQGGRVMVRNNTRLQWFEAYTGQTWEQVFPESVTP